MADTPATVFLKANKVAYTEHEYAYVEHGGTSPFGTKKSMPIYLERSILELPKIYINGGRRGFLVGISPGEIVRTLAPQLVRVAIDE